MRYTLLLLLLICFSTSSFSQCTYKSKVLGYTVTAPKGWELIVNDKPRCTGQDSFDVADDVLRQGLAMQEQIACKNGDNTFILFLFSRTESDHIDRSLEKDLHKLLRYRYRRLVFPIMKDMGLKPKNSKTYQDTLGDRTFSITRTEGKMGKEVFLTTYLYTWSQGKSNVVAIMVPEDDIQERKLMDLLKATLNSI